jgi:RHS repeat-associated protein
VHELPSRPDNPGQLRSGWPTFLFSVLGLPFFNGKRIGFTSLSSGNTHYHYNDHLGSSSVISNGDGTSIEWEADYYSFGTKHVLNNYLDTFFLFAGYEFDYETGYYYPGARHDSPTLGRFMSPDEPFADQDPSDPQSWNLYAYCRNNPLSNTDLDGHSCVSFANGDKGDDGDGKGCAEAHIAPNGTDLTPETVTVNGGSASDPCDALCQGVFHSPQGQESFRNAAVAGRCCSYQGSGSHSAGCTNRKIRGQIRASSRRGRTVGIDRVSGNPTSIYTVITDSSRNLVTAFPGKR